MDSMKGSETRSLVILNTKDCCFFCLKQIVKEEIEDGGGDNPDSEGGTGTCLFSLHTLIHYLKISLNGESEIGKEFKKLIAIGDSESWADEPLEVEVSTCSSCWMLGKGLSDQFLELERIKLEVKTSLERLKMSMPFSGLATPDAAEVLGNYYQRMEGDAESKAQLHIVDKLRKEISRKCRASRCARGKLSKDNASFKEVQPPHHAKVSLESQHEGNNGFGGEKAIKPSSSLPSLSVPQSIIKQEIPDFDPNSTPVSPTPSCLSNEDNSMHNMDFFKRLEKLKTTLKRGKSEEKEVIKLPFNFKCDRCNKPFGKRDNLRKHQKNCKGAKTRLTRRWNASFLRTYRVKGSKCIYNPETGKYKCSLCSKELSATGCRFHYEAVHLQSKFECDLCHSVYNRKYRLQVHRRTCNGIRKRQERKGKVYRNNNLNGTFDCLTCGEAYKTRDGVRRHVLKHHTNSETQINKPRRHRKPHPNLRYIPETKKYECTLCEEKFNYRRGFKNHFDAVHLQKIFKCEKCQKRLKNQTQLKLHQDNFCGMKGEEAPEGDGQEVHICEVCGKGYQSEYSLKRHKESFHSGKIYHCKFCQKEFRNRSNHWKHEKNQVCQRPDYQKWLNSKKVELGGENKCDICKIAAFESNTSEEFHQHREECLQKRMEMDLRRKMVQKQRPSQVQEGGVPGKKKKKPPPPAACPVCGKWFARRGGMKDHIKLVHLQERKYICDACGKSYKDQTQLKRHKSSVHLGEIVTCEVCQAEFKSFNSLKYHKKKCGKEKSQVGIVGIEQSTTQKSEYPFSFHNPTSSSRI